MQTIPQNIDLLLPYGEALRSFVEQPFLTPADLKQALRARGIFLSRNEKRDTIPVLTCCLLSPQEFDILRERQENREDNPKTVSRAIAWKSNTPLLAAVPEDLNLADLLFGDSVNYKVLGSPAFVPVENDPNDICCEYEVERDDLSRNWAATRSHFKGKLRLQRAHDSRTITFTLTNTSEETKDLNRRFARQLTQHFKTKGDVALDSEIETILFSSFDNEGRIAFFRELAYGLSSTGFDFIEVTDCGVCPVLNATLPADVKWMEGHVKGLKINGEALEHTVFMSEKYKAHHKLFLFYGMEARFRFDTPLAKGTCSIMFEFPEFLSKNDQNLELEVNISALALDAGQAHVNRTMVKEELLRRVNEVKLSCFAKRRLQSINDTAAPLMVDAPMMQGLQASFEWESIVPEAAQTNE